MINRILELMDAKKINAKQLTSELGLSHGVITDWKKGKAKPSTDAIMKLSKYFDVSTDYLLFGVLENSDFNTNKKEPVFDVTEDNLLEYFKKLTSKHKYKILTKIENYLEDYEDKLTDETTVKETESIYKVKKIPLLTMDDEAFINELNKTKIKTKTKKVPLLGATAAGNPIDIIEDFSDMLSVPDNVNVDFALTVKGDSMSPLLELGDNIFIFKDAYIDNGSIIVASVNETATCKKYYKRKDYIELKSLNPKYDSIIIKLDERTDFRIIGKVVLGQRDGNFFDIKYKNL